MKTFEDKLQASAQRLISQDDKHLHIPQNPLKQRKTYWGWVATPAAAVIGILFGMSLHVMMNNEQKVRYVHNTDTICIPHPVHDTLYLTQIVEKEKIIVKEVAEQKAEAVISQKESVLPACTSIQCDGIDYSVLASK